MTSHRRPDDALAATAADERCAPIALSVGEQVGRYVLERELGAGGVGVVWAARDPDLDREVAVKLVRAAPGDLEDASEAQARLRREARALARLSHPNVVAVHDVGDHRDGVYIVMELVHGETLKAWLRAPRGIPEILGVFGAAAQGLAAAHRAGLVHRDFKPDNVLVGADGRVRVADFGLARATGQAAEPAARERSGGTDPSVTRQGFVVGTPRYMAPEQFEGGAPDARSDQFAFCVALHEALYREHPFSATTIEEIVVETLAGRVRPPPAHADPAGLFPVVLRGLSVDPAGRYASMDALREVLEAARARTERAAALPAPLGRFVGRGPERARLAEQLAAARLVTVTGLGGSGKTRLALEAMRDRLGAAPGGAWFVELAPLREGAFIVQAVAQAVGVRESSFSPGGSLLRSVLDFLGEKEALLGLDTCEHLVRAAGELVGDLLGACPRLRILCTSREPLGVPGEVVFPLGPLPAGSDAVELFVDRARRYVPGFTADEASARAIESICRRVEGIPLAIELAAARVRVLSPQKIEERLAARLSVLRAGAGAQPRHRTLEATLDWSYDLLTPPERTLFGRLSVFGGSFSLEAAEHVCAGEDLAPDAVLDLLDQLVQKSLLGAEPPSGDRYRLLETVREYAHAKLEAEGRLLGCLERHGDWFAAFAESMERKLEGREQLEAFDHIERDLPNVRAALEAAERLGRPELGLHVAAALKWFWFARSPAEGREWLLRLLGSPREVPAAERARALGTAGLLLATSDAAGARDLLERARGLAIDLGDRRQAAFASFCLGWVALTSGDIPGALGHLGESRAVCEAAGDDRGLALACMMLGVLVDAIGDEADGRAQCERAAAILRRRGDRLLLAHALVCLGEVERAHRHHDLALPLYEEALASMSALDDRFGIAFGLSNLGACLVARGDLGEARAALRRSLTVSREAGLRLTLPPCLTAVASLATAGGDARTAARLLGFAAAWLERLGGRWALADGAYHEGAVAALGAHLDEVTLRRLWNEGRALELDDAIAEALRV